MRERIIGQEMRGERMKSQARHNAVSSNYGPTMERYAAPVGDATVQAGKEATEKEKVTRKLHMI